MTKDEDQTAQRQESREELEWIIEQLWHEPGYARLVERAMETLERQKILDKHWKARMLNEISDSAREEYAQLMRPYWADHSRKPSPEVQAKAQAILDKAEKADIQWAKLMGL